MVQPLLIKYKVIILPLKVINYSQRDTKVYLTMKYQFIDVEAPEKDAIEIEIPGSGYDERGRAVFAALTDIFCGQTCLGQDPYTEEKTERLEKSIDHVREKYGKKSGIYSIH